MTIESGTHLEHYEVVAAIGAGGMGVPKILFHMPPGSTVSSSWDVTADGKRFLFPATQAQSTQQSPFTAVLNWQAALNK